MEEEKSILKKKNNNSNNNSNDEDNDFIEIPDLELKENNYNNINNNHGHDDHDHHEHDEHDNHNHDQHEHINNINNSNKNNNDKHSHNNHKKNKKNKKHGHSHGGSGDHGHSHGGDSSSGSEDDEESPLKNKLKNMESKKKARYSLILALTLTTIFMVGENIGGWMANSLAIMTDAAHLLTDIGAMFLSLFAMWIAQHPPTSSMSFGFHRAEILGALVSVLMIWALTGVLVYEAIQRIIHPPEVIDGKIMFIIATCGLLINIIDAIILHWGSGGHGHSHGGSHGHSHGGGHGHSSKKKKEKLRDHDIEIESIQNSKSKKNVKNINVHSAYIHVLGDCFQSIGVMIASVIIWIRPTWKIADPITTLIFSVIVLGTTIRLLRESLGVLMEGVPPEIDVSEVKGDLSDIQGVTEVHDLHIWSITLGRPALSVHLTIAPEIDPEEILSIANKILSEDYDINHTTIQIEKPVEKSKCVDHSCPPFDIKKKKKQEKQQQQQQQQQQNQSILN